MQLSNVLRLIRRWWYVPAGLGLICALLGLVFPRPSNAERVDYFRATHVVQTVDPQGQATVTPELVKSQVLQGEVPVQVAEELDVPREAFFRQINAVVPATPGTVEITAISTDPEEAKILADLHASYLLDALDAQTGEQTTADAQILDDEIESLSSRIDSAEAEADAASTDEQRAEAQASADGLRELQDDAIAQRERLAETGGGGYRSLEDAVPVNISFEQYATRSADALRGSQDPNVRRTADAPVLPEDEGGGIALPIRAGVGGVVGLSLGVILLMIYDRIDTRIRTKEQAEEAFRLPVVVEIPPFNAQQQESREIVSAAHPRSQIAEAYRGLRTAIQSVVSAEVDEKRKDDDGRDDNCLVLMVASAGPEEGKTTTAANLAALFAEAGQSVLAFNCDYRRPRLQQYFGPIPGAEDGDKAPARAVKTGIPGVQLVTGLGEGDNSVSPDLVIASQRQVIGVGRRHFDVIVLDTPPLLLTDDASELIPEADVVLIVSRAGRTQRTQAESASALLERLRAPAMGIVLTDANEAVVRTYYYGRYGKYGRYGRYGKYGSYGTDGRYGEYYADPETGNGNGNGNGNGTTNPALPDPPRADAAS